METNIKAFVPEYCISTYRDIYVVVQFMNVATISTVVFICPAFCEKGCFSFCSRVSCYYKVFGRWGKGCECCLPGL